MLLPHPGLQVHQQQVLAEVLLLLLPLLPTAGLQVHQQVVAEVLHRHHCRPGTRLRLRLRLSTLLRGCELLIPLQEQDAPVLLESWTRVSKW